MHRLTRLSLFLTVLAIAVSPEESTAQGGFGSHATAGIFGGANTPQGDFGDEVEIGWHAGALAKARIAGSLDLRVDGTYAKFRKKDDIDGGTGTTFATDANVAFGTVSGLLNLGADSAAYPGDNTVSPYLLAGLGMYKLDYKATCSGSCTDFLPPEVENKWGVSIGGGATVPLAGLRTFIEARYHRISRSDDDGGARSMLLVSAGIKFR